MKFSIMDYDQKAAVALKLNMDDILLIRWFVDFKSTGLMKHIIVDNEVYYWISYNTVIEELPILGVTNTNVMRRRFKRLCDIGMFKFHCQRDKNGTYTYYDITKNYILLTNYKDAI